MPAFCHVPLLLIPKQEVTFSICISSNLNSRASVRRDRSNCSTWLNATDLFLNLQWATFFHFHMLEGLCGRKALHVTPDTKGCLVSLDEMATKRRWYLKTWKENVFQKWLLVSDKMSRQLSLQSVFQFCPVMFYVVAINALPKPFMFFHTKLTLCTGQPLCWNGQWPSSNCCHKVGSALESFYAVAFPQLVV